MKKLVSGDDPATPEQLRDVQKLLVEAYGEASVHDIN